MRTRVPAMKVSFVIPTRNQVQFLPRCLKSILDQNLRDAEILVIDGQSTDGTQDVLRAYGDLVTWISEPDSGQSEAVNKGVERATGEVIAWINSDDLYAGPHVLSTVLQVLERKPGFDIVFGNGLVIDATGEVIRPYRNRPFTRADQWLRSPIGPS